MHKLLTILAISTISPASNALSISYVGNECAQNAVLTEKSDRIVESKFEVIEDKGGGNYRLSLTGGLPIFSTPDLSYCIDNGDVSIGHESVIENDFNVTKKNNNDVVAYLRDGILTILVSSLRVTNHAYIDDNGTVASSVVEPHNFTLILEYTPEYNAFKLLRILSNQGVVASQGNALGKIYYELIYPGEDGGFMQQSRSRQIYYFIDQ